MDEREALKTLQSIEALLEQSLSMGKSQRVTASRKVKTAGSKKEEQADFSTLNKATKFASGNLLILGKSAATLQKAFTGVSSALGDVKLPDIDVSKMEDRLSASIDPVAASLDSLNNKIQSAVSSIKLPSIDGESASSTTESLVSVARASGIVSRRFGNLAASTEALQAAFDGAASKLLSGTRTAAAVTVDAAKSSASEHRLATDIQIEAENKQAKTVSLTDRILHKFAGGVESTDDVMGNFAKGMKDVLSSLKLAFTNVIRDIYNLEARSISASSSLTTLYGASIRAGMSLDEYTGMMEDNVAAVVRSGSMREFTEQTRAGAEQLKKLGVFGPSATKLVAAINTATVTVGIPQEQLAKATQAQTQMFERLRKTTLMTADSFRQLVADISENENVQEELLGLAPAERRARLEQLTNGATFGYQMGATAQASKQLTDALLAQRKATTVQRFQTAGAIRQAGAITGMSNAETNELARLAMKKNKTDEELKRFAVLSAGMEKRLQEMQNTENPAVQNIADRLQEVLSSGPYMEAQKAAAKVLQQAEAGGPKNADVGQETPKFLQDLGGALTTLSGILKNPLGEAMTTFASILAQSVMQVFYLSRINKGIHRLANPTLGGPGVGGKKGVLGRAMEGGRGVVKSSIDMGKGALGKIGGVVSSILSPIGATIADSVGSMTGLPAKEPRRERPLTDSEKLEQKKLQATKPKKPGIGKRVGKGLGGMFSSVKMMGIDMLLGTLGAADLDTTTFDADGNDIGKSMSKSSKFGAFINKGAKFLMKGIFKATLFGAVINSLWDAVDEMFTGDLGAAFGESEKLNIDFSKKGWLLDIGKFIFSKIDDMTMAVFRGFATFITDMVDMGLFAIGVDTKEIFGGTLTNLFDTALTQVIVWYKEFKLGIMKMVNSAGKLVGLDLYGDSIKEAESEIETSKQTLGKLKESKDKTLKNIGEENNRLQAEKAEAAKKTGDIIKASGSNVSYGIDAAIDAAKRTTKDIQQLQLDAIKDKTAAVAPQPTAATQVATPAIQKQVSVTPPEVNKTQVETVEKRTTEKTQEAKTITPAEMPEMVQLAQQQLQALNSILTAIMEQSVSQEGFYSALTRPRVPSSSIYQMNLNRQT